MGPQKTVRFEYADIDELIFRDEEPYVSER